MKKRNVQYERSLIVYIDISWDSNRKSILGLRQYIRVIAEAVEPHRFKSTFPKLPRENFTNFSDLCVLWFSLEDPKKLPPAGRSILKSSNSCTRKAGCCSTKNS